MKIDKVTITGADNKTTYNDLLNLQEDFPFVEWGILFSESREGQQRYPSSAHRAKNFIGELNLSAHFCGWWAKQVLEEKNYSLITNLPPQYKRVQLNYNFGRSSHFKLDYLLEFMEMGMDDRRIIFQLNSSNVIVLDKWLYKEDVPSRVHFLWDASGGRGTEIKDIQTPIGGHYTGYAGGLTVENIDVICSDIGRTKSNDSVWIDLESGARTNNEFDLQLVRMILKKAKYHVK